MSSMNETQKHEELPRDQFLKTIEGAEAVLAAESSKPKIQRVPFMLRDHKHFVKYYEPRAVALGPLHHGKENCMLAEKFKPALADRFIKDSGHEAGKMLEIIEVNIKRDQVAFAQQDLFLLENQLPYQVLTLLMSSSNKQEQLKIAIEEFVQGQIMAIEKKKSTGHTSLRQRGSISINMGNTEEEPEPIHLLELLRTKMLGCQESNATEKIDKVRRQSFLELLRTKMLGCQQSNATEKIAGGRRQSFRNIQELKAAGIHFRPSKKSSSLRDISFTSLGFAGLLRLPPISVDDSMGPKFSNLIAYEMCPDFQNDFGVSSYIGFLDALIDHADDVKQLRKAGVLHNLLGSDDEVAQLFNEIGTDLVPNSDTYRTVKNELEKHYKSKCKTWMAQFCHEHFSSPWTFIAFIGVLAALGLGGIQTWYAVNSPPSPCDSVCQYLKDQLQIN